MKAKVQYGYCERNSSMNLLVLLSLSVTVTLILYVLLANPLRIHIILHCVLSFFPLFTLTPFSLLLFLCICFLYEKYVHKFYPLNVWLSIWLSTTFKDITIPSFQHISNRFLLVSNIFNYLGFILNKCTQKFLSFYLRNCESIRKKLNLF